MPDVPTHGSLVDVLVSLRSHLVTLLRNEAEQQPESDVGRVVASACLDVADDLEQREIAVGVDVPASALPDVAFGMIKHVIGRLKRHATAQTTDVERSASFIIRRIALNLGQSKIERAS